MKQVAIIFVVVASFGCVVCIPVTDDTGKQGWGSGWNNGWAGGSGWNGAGNNNNGSTAIAGETIMVSNVSTAVGSSDYQEFYGASPDYSSGSLQYTQYLNPYTTSEIVGDGSDASELTSQTDDYPSFAYAYGPEGEQYSDPSTSMNVSLTNFNNTYLNNQPSSIILTSISAGAGGDFASVTNGTNLINNGWGSSSGWKKED